MASSSAPRRGRASVAFGLVAEVLPAGSAPQPTVLSFRAGTNNGLAAPWGGHPPCPWSHRCRVRRRTPNAAYRADVYVRRLADEPVNEICQWPRRPSAWARTRRRVRFEYQADRLSIGWGASLDKASRIAAQPEDSSGSGLHAGPDESRQAVVALGTTSSAPAVHGRLLRDGRWGAFFSRADDFCQGALPRVRRSRLRRDGDRGRPRSSRPRQRMPYL